jgi:hypothetical protein
VAKEAKTPQNKMTMNEKGYFLNTVFKRIKRTIDSITTVIIKALRN